MRKLFAGAVATAMAAALLSPGTATAVDDVNTERLRNAVTVRNILAHERAFQRIATANGGTRASGTPGYDASADYVAQTLRRAGYSVRKQTFTFPFYQELAPAELSQVSPTAADYETASFTYSGSGDVTGVVVPIDVQIPPGPTPSSSTSGCEPADFPTAPAGNAIALIQRGTCTFQVKAENAAAAGYEAVIIFNEGQEGRTDLLTGTLGVPQTIPVVGLSFADGEALYADTEAGTVTARVFTSVEFDPDRETVNVIASSPQGRQPGNAVIVGAHLDSVIEGPGINDNGSGSATTLEIAVQMARLGYLGRLQRQVRFAFWGAEELGLIGSEYYVNSLTQAQQSRIYANLNFDMVGSPNYVRFVYDGDASDFPPPANGIPSGSAEIESIFTEYFESQGLASAPTEFSGRSDYGPFIEAGIPAGGLFSGAEGIKTEEEAEIFGGTAGEAYDSCYHQACDNIGNLNSNALFELGDAAAHATATLALSRSGLFPDGSRVPQRKAATAKKAAADFKGHAAVR